MNSGIPLIILTKRDGRRLSSAFKRRHTQIYANAYVETAKLPHEREPWEQRDLVTKLRMEAVRAVVGKELNSPKITFTLSAGLADMGISHGQATPPIAIRSEATRTHVSLLPEIKLAKGAVAQVPLRRLRLAESTAGTSSTLLLDHVAVDCARALHPSIGFTNVSMILAALARFDKWHPDPGRSAEAGARRRIRAVNEGVSIRWARARSTAVIDAADAGAETPGEATVKWIVLCLLQGSRLNAIKLVSQYMVETGGERYFLDLALPNLQIALEFDGMGKLNTADPDHTKELRRLFERQNELQRRGWRFIRITFWDLLKLPATVASISRQLRSFGLPVGAPGGPLWKDPLRRGPWD